MASTYVQITREEFEQWLTSLTPKGKEGWDRVQGRAGVYLSHLSGLVSILIYSSIGGSDTAMSKDKGTMSMKLVARNNYARVLNKKEVGKKFYRTTNWRTNLTKGIQAFRDVYVTAKEFYDHLAGVVDLVAYQREWLDKLEAIPGSDRDTLLVKFQGLLNQGKTLSLLQEGLITKALATSRKDPSPSARPHVSLGPPPELITKVQGLFDALGWTILKSFLDQLRQGRFLSDVQMETVAKAERTAQNTRSAPLPSFAADPTIVQRLEALDKVLSSNFTRSLLDQARKRPLSSAQMMKVKEMEEGIAKARATPVPPALDIKDILRLLEELEDDEASLRQQEHRSFMDKYELEMTSDRARQNREDLRGFIITMGRSAQGEERYFLRKVFADLRGGEELDDDTYARLRRMVSVPSRSAHTNIHVRFVDIPYIA